MPSVVKHYNQFMGGVDLSDQLIGYHCILRQTKYWKTLLYHLLEDGITNAFVLHKWQLMMQGTRTPSESLFRDKVVLSIIRSYSPTPDPLSYPATCRVQHGSTAFSGSSRRCCYCQQRTLIALIVHFNQYSASTLTETAMESGIPRLQCKSACVVQEAKAEAHKGRIN